LPVLGFRQKGMWSILFFVLAIGFEKHTRTVTSMAKQNQTVCYTLQCEDRPSVKQRMTKILDSWTRLQETRTQTNLKEIHRLVNTICFTYAQPKKTFRNQVLNLKIEEGIKDI
jgi:uncharacterized membrane protein YhiD involved in acid resistance